MKVNVKGVVYIWVGELDILLIGRLVLVNDFEFFCYIGIELMMKKIIGLKVKNYFRVVFELFVGFIIYVDVLGVVLNCLMIFNY